MKFSVAVISALEETNDSYDFLPDTFYPHDRLVVSRGCSMFIADSRFIASSCNIFVKHVSLRIDDSSIELPVSESAAQIFHW